MQETRRAVLDALADGPLSGPALADDLGISRAAVWKQVEALREAGFAIESTDRGYVVESVPDYGGPAIEFGLDAPFEIEYHDALPSTNTRARELADAGRSGVAVVADEQTGGRGRLDREWASPPGGIWLSLLLAPDLPPAHAPVLTLAAAVAVAETAREAGVDARIKWPNDVLVVEKGGDDPDATADDVTDTDTLDHPVERKLAGVLTEMEGEADRVSWVIVGIGINISADGLPADATGLAEHAAGIERRAIVQRVLERFDALAGDPDAVLSAWRERALTLGRRVRVETGSQTIVGRAVEIEFPGSLVIETAEGTRRVHAGDCEHLRPA